jgi:hypothetical protein
MTGVFFDPSRNDKAWRDMIYDGAIIILSPTPEMLALVEHTRRMIEDAFVPLDPQRVHESLAVERCVEILSALKPSYIHHPHTKELIQRALNAFGCSAEKTYQDVPRLRCAFPRDYLTTGIAYAHHPHRDTWYSAPMCQFNWWAPMYEFVSENGMAFHPRYWTRGVKNGSRDFNYYRWNAAHRPRYPCPTARGGTAGARARGSLCRPTGRRHRFLGSAASFDGAKHHEYGALEYRLSDYQH